MAVQRLRVRMLEKIRRVTGPERIAELQLPRSSSLAGHRQASSDRFVVEHLAISIYAVNGFDILRGFVILQRKSGSPACTRSPGDFSQPTNVPSSMDQPKRGKRISISVVSVMLGK